MRKGVEGTRRQMKRSDGGTLRRTLSETKGMRPENRSDHETCATFMKPWWNLGETLVEPWWNFPQNLLPAQDGSAPENQRHHETWRFLVQPWRNPGEPSADPFGSPRRISPREPETPRNLENLGATLVEPW